MRDEDKFHDEFKPGLSKDNRDRADQLLDNLRIPPHFEKRNIAEDFRNGWVNHRRLDKPVQVLLSRNPVDGEKYHVVYSVKPLPEVRDAEISIRRMNQAAIVIGRIEFSHEGKRAEDQTEHGPVLVSRFYPFS